MTTHPLMKMKKILKTQSLKNYLLFKMIKLGTQVQHKLHDDLNGDVVQLNRRSNTATVKYWIDDYEPMLVSCYLSDLEAA